LRLLLSALVVIASSAPVVGKSLLGAQRRSRRRGVPEFGDGLVGSWVASWSFAEIVEAQTTAYAGELTVEEIGLLVGQFGMKSPAGFLENQRGFILVTRHGRGDL
jgi:hypothetical protein